MIGSKFNLTDIANFYFIETYKLLDHKREATIEKGNNKKGFEISLQRNPEATQYWHSTAVDAFQRTQGIESSYPYTWV